MGMIILGALILALIILITGIVMLLLSRRFLPRGRTARNVLAVISGCFVLAGIVFSIGPISVLVQSAYYRATPPEGFVETGVSVENWDNGRFTADGVEYQLVDLEFNVLLAENFTGEAAFTYDEPGRANDSRNLNFYPVENESGFALYWPSRYLNLYCPADQVEQVLDYYQSDASGRAYFLKDNGLHPVDDKTAAALEPLLTEDLNGSGSPTPVARPRKWTGLTFSAPAVTASLFWKNTSSSRTRIPSGMSLNTTMTTPWNATPSPSCPRLYPKRSYICATAKKPSCFRRNRTVSFTQTAIRPRRRSRRPQWRRQ